MFQSSCPLSLSHQQPQGSSFPHSCQHLLFSVISIPAVLVGVRLGPIVVLTCFSLTTGLTSSSQGAERLLLCLLARVYLLQRNICLPIFSIVFLPLLLSCKHSLYTPDPIPSSDT